MSGPPVAPATDLLSKVDSLLSRHRGAEGGSAPLLTDPVAAQARPEVPRLTDVVGAVATTQDPGQARRLKAALYLALRDRLAGELAELGTAADAPLRTALLARLPAIAREAVNRAFGEDGTEPPAPEA